MPSASMPNILYISYDSDRKSVLGKGRYAEVYLGSYWTEEDQTRRPCAIKDYHDDEESRDMALAELSFSRKIGNSKYIMSIIGVVDAVSLRGCIENDQLDFEQLTMTSSNNRLQRMCTVMPYANHGDLMNLIRENPKLLSRQTLYRYSYQLAVAVQAMHGVGLIHHDIKPHNILVIGEEKDLLLADYSHAAYVDPVTKLRKDGLGRGTTAYTAPEILSLDDSYSFPADVYSYGLVIFMLMTGEEPFNSLAHPPTMIHAIRKGFWFYHRKPGQNGDMIQLLDGSSMLDDDTLATLVIQCLSKNAKDRPTIEEIIQDIEMVAPQGILL